ncbi:putative ribonuclease H-like domain-containing protein, partial [Tanacetum coccineum]
ILNTIDHLGKFDGKADEGFFVGYSINSKAFRVFNSRTRIVEENLHVQFSKNTPNIAGSTKSCDDPGDNEKKATEEPRKEGGDSSYDQEKEDNVNGTNNVNAASTNEVNVVCVKTSIELPDDLNMPELEVIIYSDDDEDVGVEADMNNLNTLMPVSPIPTIRKHKDHPIEQIIGDLNLAPQTRRMTKNLEEHSLFSSVQQRTNHKDFQNYLFVSFLSQEEPKKVIHALTDPSWIEAMQDELLQFKLQKWYDKKIVVTKASVRRDLQLDDEEGTDCLPNATIFEELTRMGYEKLSQKLTFYKAFFSPQWKFLIHTILQCLSAKTTAWNEFSSTMASAIIYEVDHEEALVSMQFKELVDFCTKLQQRVLDLENTKITQAQEITSLKIESVRIVSSDKASLGDQDDASKQGRKIHDIDADEDITLENVHDAEMFDVNDLHGDECVKVQDKGKGILVEEPVKSIKKKDQIRLDEELAFKLQAEEEEEERKKEFARDKKLAFKQQLKKKKNKDLQGKNVERQSKRAEEKRNRPPTRAQQRSMITELVEGTEMEESSKKAEVMEESSKTAEKGKEAAKMKELMKIIPDEEESSMLKLIAIFSHQTSKHIVDWEDYKKDISSTIKL